MAVKLVCVCFNKTKTCQAGCVLVGGTAKPSTCCIIKQQNDGCKRTVRNLSYDKCYNTCSMFILGSYDLRPHSIVGFGCQSLSAAQFVLLATYKLLS